jgi:hypothetical protein
MTPLRTALRPRTRWAAAGAALLAAASLGACTGSSKADKPSGLPAGTGAYNLKGDCPSTVVMQSDWVPEAEHGGAYKLLGPNPDKDFANKRVTAPLVIDGHDTGVKLQIRAGGPAVPGFQAPAALMAEDHSIMLGMVGTDDAISQSAKVRVTGVFAQLEISPLGLMWSPDQHKDWQSIADIGQSNATVLVFPNSTYVAYLVGSGLLKSSQVDSSYKGAPDRWVTSHGAIAQQGFVTDEPYYYTHLLKEWKGKKVDFSLVNDAGYVAYPSTWSVRTADLDKDSACLKKLVPILQRGEVEYVKSPKATNKLIVDLVKGYNVGIDYSQDRADASAGIQLQRGIVSNGTNNTLGDFNLDRVARVIKQIEDILDAQNTHYQSGLKPTDLVTNQFIDPGVHLTL